MVMVKIINTNQKVYLKTYGENHDAIFNRCGKCVHFKTYAQITQNDQGSNDTGLCTDTPHASGFPRPQVSVDDSCPDFKRRSEK